MTDNLLQKNARPQNDEIRAREKNHGNFFEGALPIQFRVLSMFQPTIMKMTLCGMVLGVVQPAPAASSTLLRGSALPC